MVRRDFLKNTALAAATAAVYSPLSAATFGKEAQQKVIAIVSESAYETGYRSALEKGGKADEVISLGTDGMNNLYTLTRAIENNPRAIFCGLLTPSDHVLLNHVAMTNSLSFVSEIAHTPVYSGIAHTESTFAMTSAKKAFDQFASLNTDQYGRVLCSYHTSGTYHTSAMAKQVDFVSDHASKNAFVSFVLKA
ncbi:twin-arginine translocation signal domain-containing protein [Sulfuricurvum sp.]|uniref:twin-arginine translocation signal domain-containing protein n=1 Tax=Sulfuricurvum sp. TaxID=2025608 RepID=UPI00262CDE44|nr:twin-arginine translocation signal domain-containing protein [Sulfuricurvum sp.]MDD3597307.1 twin-arginine translocation signal domain-containing protein [Sulfuricurvum sp.]MDD4883822.1 twin-arginine translocation signal domain-containing protein [Sulfuricurvum sp.]